MQVLRVCVCVCTQEYLAYHHFVISMDFWLSHGAFETSNTYAIIITDDVMNDTSTKHSAFSFVLMFKDISHTHNHFIYLKWN